MPVVFAKRISAWARAAHLGHRAGGRFHRLGPHGLDRVDDGKRRRATLAQGGDDVLDIGLRGEFDGRLPEAETLGAQAHLRHRLFAGDVGDALAPLGQGGGGLHEEGRLADAGIAAEQDDRAVHEAAAGDAVELGDAGGRARRFLGLAGQAFEREDPALGAGRARGDRPGHRAGGAGFLDDAVPAAAGLALAFPAVIDRAAFLADEGGVTLGHQPSPPR